MCEAVVGNGKRVALVEEEEAISQDQPVEAEEQLLQAICVALLPSNEQGNALKFTLAPQFPDI